VDHTILANLLHAPVMVIYARHVLRIFLDATFVGSRGVILLIAYPWGIRQFLGYERHTARARK
jgi:hypothetical protein